MTSAVPDSEARIWWPAALLPVLAVAAFGPGLPADFVHWDDVEYIATNPHMSDWEGLRRIWCTLELPQYYPLTFTTYWIEHRVWGIWPAGTFLVNLALHAASSLLLYLVLRGLDVGRGTAWLVAAVFAVHPIQAGSVAWLAQRKNTLSGVFCWLTMLAYFRFLRRGARASYLAAVLAYGGALLSKTAVAPLPISLALADWLVRGQPARRALVRVVPLIVLGVAAGVVTIVAERVHAPRVPTAGPQPLLAGAAVWVYVAKILWPAVLLPLYPPWHVSAQSVAWWLPAIGVAGVVAIVYVWRRRVGGLRIWALAHFFLLLFPSLGVVPFAFVLTSPIGDHFVHLALPGFVLFVVTLVRRDHAAASADASRAARATPRRAWAAGRVLGGLVLAGLMAKSWQQVPIWRDGVALWSYTAAHNPACAEAHNNLGIALREQGRYEEALSSFRHAVRLQGDSWLARTNVAGALRELGRLDEAAEEFRALAAARPEDGATRLYLADTLVLQGKFPEAIEEYGAAIRLKPDMARAHANLGMTLIGTGEVAEGYARLERALQLARGAREHELAAWLVQKLAQRPAATASAPSVVR